MEVSASQIASDIRSRHHELKDLMKRNKVWDPDVEFKRQEVRRYQLQLLFKFPSEKEAKEVENQLWMTTSHAFITAYKGLLNALDRDKSHNSPPPGKGGKPPKNIVEKRKLLQRFRQFLNAEEKFWRMFITRYGRFFDLREANVLLQPLKNGESDQEDEESNRSLFPDGKSVSPNKKNDQDSRLATLSKALVCLGDLTRYREQLGEHKKPDTPGSRGGRGGHHQSPAGRSQPSKAQEIYEIARSLVPDSGNASHQLAILANYQKDTFTAVYHYYRALCIRHPFETAAENLQTTLNKALNIYRAKQEHKANGKDVSLPTLALVEQLKEKVVILHASWNTTLDESNFKFSDMQLAFTTDFTTLMSDRTLPVETIIRIIVMSVGAVWRIRLVRDPKKDAQETSATEQRIATHLLGAITSLLRVGVLQVSDGREMQSTPGGTTDLGFGITAVFRRMLPALRVSSKWVRAHLAYLLNLNLHEEEELKTTLTDFWAAYQSFFTTLKKNFPPSQIPVLSNPLEEDVDMTGFLPLKKTMKPASSQSMSGLVPGQSQVHPNEEHLMRISDLLTDAMDVAKNDKSPIDYLETSARFIFKGLERRAPQPRLAPAPPPDVLMIPPSVASHQILQKAGSLAMGFEEEPEDDGATVSTRTDDDPVNLAMKATLDLDISDQELDMEDDEIVYPKQNLITPVKPIGTVSPNMAFNRYSLPPGSPANSATPRKLSSHGDSLLASLPDLSRAAKPASLLFGGGMPGVPGEETSIWSTSYDNTTPTFVGASRSPRHDQGGWPLPLQPQMTDPGPRISGFQANAPSNFMSSSFSNPMYGGRSPDFTPLATSLAYQGEQRDPFYESQPYPQQQHGSLQHAHTQRMWAAPP